MYLSVSTYRCFVCAILVYILSYFFFQRKEHFGNNTVKRKVERMYVTENYIKISHAQATCLETMVKKINSSSKKNYSINNRWNRRVSCFRSFGYRRYYNLFKTVLVNAVWPKIKIFKEYLFKIYIINMKMLFQLLRWTIHIFLIIIYF